MKILFFLPILVLCLAACGGAAAPTPPIVVQPIPSVTAAPPSPESADAATPAPPSSATIASDPTASAPAVPPANEGLTLPTGYLATAVVTGLQGPTQMILGPDGRLWVAQLAGRENDGTGQVVALSLDNGSSETLLTGLVKPTGIAVLGDALWIASGNALLRAPLSADGVGAPETVLADLPFNGRSNGTLTVTPDGELLFETSGRRSGNAPSEGSATLWALDPAASAAPRHRYGPQGGLRAHL